MFDIDNLINSQVDLDPWRHQIVDKFFSKDHFDKIEKAAKDLLMAYNGQYITANNCLTIAQVYDTIGQEVFDILLEINSIILDNIDRIVLNYPNHRKFIRYASIPTFHILPKNFGPQKIHDESYDKTCSIVVYLYPNMSIGTAFFKGSTQDTFVKELEWKQNRGMIFCGEKHVTWHDFYSRDNPRVTLNFFIRELKHINIEERNESKCITGIDGPQVTIPNSLPDNVIERLFSGVLFK